MSIAHLFDRSHAMASFKVSTTCKKSEISSWKAAHHGTVTADASNHRHLKPPWIRSMHVLPYCRPHIFTVLETAVRQGATYASIFGPPLYSVEITSTVFRFRAFFQIPFRTRTVYVSPLKDNRLDCERIKWKPVNGSLSQFIQLGNIDDGFGSHATT
jgi:hypothetical protein